ncbi:MAG TPA: orotidine-5'-phosphate decarboxylase [Nitrospirales bacterium]|nr:orotidine-5'-phosphate decarboxylase [Nitrospirales bacterium]
MTIKARDRLIFALDVSSSDEAKRLLDRVGDAVGFVKIGLELFTAAGPDIVRWTLVQNKRVFLDLKLFDIKETVKRASVAAAELGATFLSVHATGQTVRAAVEGRGNSPMKILAVTVLTSFSEADLRETGVADSIPTTVLRRASLAASSGADGLVASGVEAAMIRRALGQDPLIVIPGIRPLGKPHDDQVHVTTPAEAIAAGADYLVVGRPIRDAADPVAAARAIQSEIEIALTQGG